MASSIVQLPDISVAVRQQNGTQSGSPFESRALYRSLDLSPPGITGAVERSWFSTSGQQGRYLQVSPYPSIEHSLDLAALDAPNLLLALALTNLEPSTPHYATALYAQAFNWSAVFANLRSFAQRTSFNFPPTEFYIVEFRSKLKKSLDKELLSKLDKESHREATVSGGLLKYWFGSPDSERRNLATCLWRSKDDALAGGRGPWHKQARNIVASTYENIDIQGLRLIVEEGAKSWRFEPFSQR